MNARQRRIVFFQEHGGYCTPPGRMVCAKSLADGEEAAESAGAVYTWEYDDDADASFVETWPEKDQREWREKEHECLWVALRGPDGELLSSLSGIFDPDNDYRRVVEAELASEAIDALRTLGDNI